MSHELSMFTKIKLFDLVKIFLAFAFISDIIGWLPKNRKRGGRKSEDLKVMRVCDNSICHIARREK